MNRHIYVPRTVKSIVDSFIFSFVLLFSFYYNPYYINCKNISSDTTSLSRSEIVKNYYNAGKPADLYYYRDIDKKEIDLLIIEGNRLYPVEIKRSKEPADPDKNFKVLSHLGLEVMPGICICMSDDIIPYNRDVWYVPITVL